jgi:hypothetical protein
MRLDQRLVVLGCLGLLACAQRPVGSFTARDHVLAGRPLEALAASSAEEQESPWWPLDEGMFLQMAERYAQSQVAWSRVPADAGLTPVERTGFARLQQLNLAALHQDATLLAQLLAPGNFSLQPLAAGQASIVVVVESGWAPVPRLAAQTVQTGGRPRRNPQAPPAPSAIEVAFETPLPLTWVRLNALPAVQPTVVFDDTREWAAAGLARSQAQRADDTTGGTIDFAEVFHRAGQANRGWWSAPTRLSAIELITTAGSNVVLVPTPGGLRERAVELAPGQRMILVTRQ